MQIDEAPVATFARNWSPHISRTFANEIATEVLAALRSTGYRELYELEVRIDGHDVFLRGRVPSYFMKQKAEYLVARLHGVQQVISDICVGNR